MNDNVYFFATPLFGVLGDANQGLVIGSGLL